MKNMLTRTGPHLWGVAKSNVWDQACDLVIERGNDFYPVAPIDKGVNFFVLALEELGAKPRFSCEGHPYGFYIAFEASYELALEIRSCCSYFTVELEGLNYWSIRKTSSETRGVQPYTENEKVQVLRPAATAWVNYFGPRLSKVMRLIAVGQLTKQK